MRNWGKYKLEQIVGGKNTDDSSMLEEFLKDYAKVFSVNLDSLQPSCNKCLTRYYNQIILKLSDMSTECNYKLLKKFNGIPLEFGSSIFVTNANITNEYAEKLISRYLDVYENKKEDFTPEILFEKFPANWEDAQFEDDDQDQDPDNNGEGTGDDNEGEGEGEGDADDNEDDLNLDLDDDPKDEDLKLSELRKKYPDIKAGSKADFLAKLKQ